MTAPTHLHSDAAGSQTQTSARNRTGIGITTQMRGHTIKHEVSILQGNRDAQADRNADILLWIGLGNPMQESFAALRQMYTRPTFMKTQISSIILLSS
jgi:hypothetical protein